MGWLASMTRAAENVDSVGPYTFWVPKSLQRLQKANRCWKLHNLEPTYPLLGCELGKVIVFDHLVLGLQYMFMDHLRAEHVQSSPLLPTQKEYSWSFLCGCMWDVSISRKKEVQLLG